MYVGSKAAPGRMSLTILSPKAARQREVHINNNIEKFFYVRPSHSLHTSLDFGIIIMFLVIVLSQYK